MTIDKSEKGANLRDVQLAIAKSFGLTDEEAGRRVQTPEAPDGVSVRTVQNRLSRNGDFIKGLVAWILPFVRQQQAEIEEISKEKYRGELEKLRGMILTVRKNALLSEDLALANKVADTIEDRLDGKAINRAEVLSAHLHKHQIEVSEESMRRFETLANKLKLNIPLPALPPKADDVIDA